MKLILNIRFKLWQKIIYLLAIQMFFAQSGFAQNKVVVDSLLNTLESRLSEKEQIDVYLNLSKQYVRSDTTQMMLYINKTLEISDEETRIDVIDLLGFAYAVRGKYTEAEAKYKMALEKSISQNYVKGEARAYARVATTYLFQGNLDTTNYLFNKSIEIQEALNDPEILAFTFHNMGTYNVFRGNFNKAIEYYHQSLELKEQYGDINGTISTYIGIANTYGYQAMSLPALENYFKALDLIEKGGSKRSLPNVINNIGNIYHSRTEYRRALKYYEQSLKLYQELNDSRRIALTYKNMGYSTLQLKEHGEAIEYLEQSLAMYEVLGDKVGKSSALNSLGEAYSEIDQDLKALKLYEQSLKIRREIGDNTSIAMSLTGMGFAHLKMGNLKQVKENVNELMPIAQKLGSFDELERAYLLASDLDYKRGNYKRAYDAYVKFKQFQDSIQNQENSRKITLLEADYEFQQEKDSIVFEQAKIELAYEQEIERRKVVNQAAIGAGVLVLIILLLLYRSYLIKQKRNLELRHKNELIESKNKELTFKNNEITSLRETEKKMAEDTLALKERELTNVTMLSHEKNELLTNIGNQIGNLSGRVADEIVPDLKEIKHTIKSNISDESWNSFTYHFEQVHPEFFNKLKEEFEDLNQNDLRLCAYIKVGLNNKVIAQMGNVTLAAVKKNINRLKKKMEISPEGSLRDFMMEFV